jgi:hypothetical protein
MARVLAVQVGVFWAIRVSWYKMLEGCEVVMVFQNSLDGKARLGFVMDSLFVLAAGLVCKNRDKLINYTDRVNYSFISFSNILSNSKLLVTFGVPVVLSNSTGRTFLISLI